MPSVHRAMMHRIQMWACLCCAAMPAMTCIGRHTFHSPCMMLQRNMTAMLKAWSNVSLRQAFNGWTTFVQAQQDKHELQHRALLFWNARELAQVIGLLYCAVICVSSVAARQAWSAVGCTAVLKCKEPGTGKWPAAFC